MIFGDTKFDKLSVLTIGGVDERYNFVVSNANCLICCASQGLFVIAFNILESLFTHIKHKEIVCL